MNQKILIIDGHPVYSQRLEGFLKGLTYKNIELACSGRAGIDGLRSYSPDVVILSGMLPDMDTFEVCRKIREESPAVRIIVQVGIFAEIDLVEKFHNNGADVVLARKEKDMRNLQQAIEQLS